jgi:hypothetical protein
MVMTFALVIQGYQDGQPDALRRFAQSEEGDVKHLQGMDPPLYRSAPRTTALFSATSAIP